MKYRAESIQAPRVHPKMRSRWVQARREEGRRRLRTFVVLASLLALAAVFWGALHTPLFDVDRVEVSGNSALSDAEVRQRSGVEGAQMLYVDAAEVRRKLLASPRVKSADIERRWPATVMIRIAERKPAAVMRNGKEWIVLDHEGRAIQESQRRPANLPELAGVNPPGEGGRAGPEIKAPLNLVAVIPPDLRGRFPSVFRKEDGTLEVLVTGTGGRPATVFFGPPAQIAEKMTSLVTVMNEIDFRGVATVDVRVPSVPAVTRAGSS